MKLFINTWIGVINMRTPTMYTDNVHLCTDSVLLSVDWMIMTLHVLISGRV